MKAHTYSIAFVEDNLFSIARKYKNLQILMATSLLEDLLSFADGVSGQRL